MDMITQGMIAALTVLWLLSYVGFRRVFAYNAIVDLVITGGFVYMFAGSYAGMMTGVIAGLFVSITLKFGRAIFGAERLTLARRKGHVVPEFVWIRSK